MRKLREWILTLGVLAAAPAVGLAGPFSLPSMSPFKADKTSNQEVAEQIATSLQQAQLRGTDIQIEYKGGVATLLGQVSDAAQKAKASSVVAQIPGVKTVDNKLTVQAAAPTAGGLQQAAFFDGPAQPRFGGIQQVSAEEEVAPSFGPNNQEVAENIAGALSSAGLNGYDIQISYQNGTATLAGSVANPQQRVMAESIASKVNGVKLVSNQLMVPQAQTAQAAPRMPMPGYGPQGPQGPQGPAFQPVGYQGQPGPAPMSAYGLPGAHASHTVHNSPNLPSHAYPSYGAYPNSAAISYPKQYSASAWPYIGPFYPYPQVPLGWRKASLTWDDGAWSLQFDPKTDKWWWFMNPKNW